MRIYILFLLAFVCGVLFSIKDLYANDKPPIVVELFTSEFCPACPPADQYLGTLSDKENVIALGCHVTYFKRNSNLGRQECTQRQFDYVQRLKERSPYTPQFVLNGRRSVVGTQVDEVAASLIQASADKIALINITPKPQRVYSYDLPQIKRGSYEIMLATYQKDQKFSRSTYANAVDKITKVGLWDGGSDVRVIYPDVKKRHKGFALFVQNKRSGEIVAAGDMRF